MEVRGAIKAMKAIIKLRMRLGASILILLLLVPSGGWGVGQGDEDGVQTSRKLIMFLFDAFRYDYADLPGLTGLPRVFKRGVRAEYMLSEYPTNSWPNHYSLTTGLHVDIHGMIDNSMYDPVLNETFEPGEENYWKPHWWNGGDPIWITATRQGLRAHMYYWLGSDVEIRGLRPAWWRDYPDAKFESAGATFANLTIDIDEAVEGLKNNSVDLVGIYLDRPDHFGHRHGTWSAQLNETIRRTDKLVNHVLEQLDTHELNDVVDVMIFSDHGMTNTSFDRRIFLKDYITEEEWNSAILFAAGSGFWPKEGKKEFVYNRLKNKHPNMTIYYKEELPEDEFWHLKNNRRTPPLWLKVDIGWYTVYPNNTRNFTVGGRHGYDNHARDMRASFFATGPHFKKGYIAPHFPNVDLYQIMCKILNIEPSPNNGTWSHIEGMLVPGNWNKMIRTDPEARRTYFSVINKQMLAIFAMLLAFLLL